LNFIDLNADDAPFRDAECRAHARTCCRAAPRKGRIAHGAI